ncbi:hypothetical protein C5B42_03545, partial [Candidatus Cerribacteria bacterium 'Amazon FNV 2010 28 9']
MIESTRCISISFSQSDLVLKLSHSIISVLFFCAYKGAGRLFFVVAEGELLNTPLFCCFAQTAYSAVSQAGNYGA